MLGCLTRAREAAFWLGLTVIGQAAVLQLVDAGPTVHYQHLRPLLSMASGLYKLFFAIVIVQLICVAIRLFQTKAQTALWRSCKSVMSRWRWMGVLSMMVLCGATLSRDPSEYAEELVLSAIIQAVNLGTLLLFVRALPNEWLAKARRLFGRVSQTSEAGQRRLRIDTVALIGSIWVVSFAILLSVFVYQRHPHVPDEVGYLLHARYFAEGMLAMPVPPVPEGFDVDLLAVSDGKWYSPVPPGWPAVLAIGAFFGVPWLVNPLLAGINVLLVFLIVDRLYDRQAARVAVVLLAASPWHLFMAMNFMTHTLLFTCLLVAALAVEQMRACRSALYGIPGGVALGVASLVRPLDGLLIAIAVGVWSLRIRGRLLRYAPAVVLTLTSIVVGAIQLPYNAAMTGDARTFPLMKYFDELYGEGRNDLGFGANRGFGWELDPYPGHGLRDVLVNANLNLTTINVELFGWSVGSLLLIWAFGLSGAFRRTDYCLAAFICLVVAILSLYWFSGGPDFAARYWYPMLLPLILLTARGVKRAVHFVEEAGAGGTRVYFGVAALVLSSFVTFVPWRALDKYYHYRGMEPGISSLVPRDLLGKGLVLVRGARAPDYASASVYNPLDLSGNEPIFVWDRTPEVRSEALKVYADRAVWFVDGPTITGRGYEIAGGPMSTSKALGFKYP